MPCGSVVRGFGVATAVEGVDVGACVGLSGVVEEVVVGARSVVAVRGENV